MAVSDTHNSSPRRLADRVAAARRRHFVGRVGELELFRSALFAPEPPFALLYLYGPGGIGKTTLLGEYARLAEAAGFLTLHLDARRIEPSPEGFRHALRQALHLPAGAAPVESLSGSARSVLLIDTFEILEALSAWLLESFLPELPDQCLVVVAGRNAPPSLWQSLPGWHDLIRVVALRNLRPEESRAYLAGRAIPAAQHDPVLAFTHGHPLALALVGDLLGQAPAATAFSSQPDPNVVRTLLERLLEQVPSPRHRQALELAAHVRVTTEGLLGAAFEDEAAAPALFEWLRSLSFVEVGPQGLFPHDLVREVLDADLRWRNPEAYAQLHRQARRYVLKRVHETEGVAQQRAFFDFMYLNHRSPLVSPYYDWKTLGYGYAEPASPADHPRCLEMIARFEGPASAELAAYWLRRQPESFVALRTEAGELAGVTAILALHQATAEDRAMDPGARAAWDFAQRHGPPRPGEEMQHYRFFGNAGPETATTAQSLAAMVTSLPWLVNPRLAWAFISTLQPEARQPLMTYLSFQRVPEADFDVGGQHYAVFAHDWRAEPTELWLERLARRDLVADLKPEMIEPAPPALLVLSQPEFKEAVRQALRSFTRPDELADSPLVRSRLVREALRGQPPALALQRLLREAAESLRAGPKDDKFYRAVWHTYFEPAASQEQAAERLGVPFSTYRYQLTTALDRLTDWLWQRELYGPEA